MPANALRSRAAAVEDYDSDNSEARPDTRKTAEVRYGRTSRPYSVSKASKPVRPGPPDAASDSGYSSRTNNTTTSGEPSSSPNNVAQSTPSRGTIIPIQERATSRPAQQRPAPRPHEDSRPRSPLGGTGRARSSSQRPGRAQHVEPEECRDPNCCEYRPRRRESMTHPSPVGRPMSFGYASHSYPWYHPQYPQHPPLSPTLAAFPARDAYHADQAHVRPRATSTTQPRPMSYSGIQTPEEYEYWRAQALEYARRPPAAMAGYPSLYDMDPNYQYPHPQAGMPPQSAAYPPIFQTLPFPTSPIRPANARPVLHHAATDNMSPRRRDVSQAPRVVTCDLPRSTYATASAGPSAPVPSLRRQHYAMPGAFYSSSSSDSETDMETEQDIANRRAMPPPAEQPGPRPPLKQHLTTPVLSTTRPSGEVPLRSHERARSDARYTYKDYVYSVPSTSQTTDELTRHDCAVRVSQPTPSSRRPSLAPNPSTKSKSYNTPSNTAKVTIESQSSRRQSYTAHSEQRAASELAAQQQQQQQRPRRRNEAHRTEAAAEAYQTAVSGSRMPEMTAESLPKQPQQRLSMTHKSRSTVSSGEHSRSHKPRRSDGHSVDSGGSQISRTADGGMKIRMHAGTTVEFARGLEGCNVSWRAPDAVGGQAELVIGAGRAGRDKELDNGKGSERRRRRESSIGRTGGATVGGRSSRAKSEVRGRRDSKVRSTVEYDRI